MPRGTVAAEAGGTRGWSGRHSASQLRRLFFFAAREGSMGVTTIVVIVLAVLVFGGMAVMLIYINTEPKKKK